MTDRAVIWHDVENGSYAADLPLWRELAAAAGGPVLDLGAGTGRVTADLARAGHDVTALDLDSALLAELRRRVPGAEAVEADATRFAVERRFALVIAPMQLLQIVGGPERRTELLARARGHLLPGGCFAAALADPYEALAEEDRSPPYPDMIERAGWVFSSTPMWVREERDRIMVQRRRQAVAPDGRLDEELAPFALDVVGAGELEEEARAARLTPVERRGIPETADHIGSTVVICVR